MNTIVSSRASPAEIGKIFLLVSAVFVKAREIAIGDEHTAKEALYVEALPGSPAHVIKN